MIVMIMMMMVMCLPRIARAVAPQSCAAARCADAGHNATVAFCSHNISDTNTTNTTAADDETHFNSTEFTAMCEAALSEFELAILSGDVLAGREVRAAWSDGDRRLSGEGVRSPGVGSLFVLQCVLHENYPRHVACCSLTDQ